MGMVMYNFAKKASPPPPPRPTVSTPVTQDVPV